MLSYIDGDLEGVNLSRLAACLRSIRAAGLGIDSGTRVSVSKDRLYVRDDRWVSTVFCDGDAGKGLVGKWRNFCCNCDSATETALPISSCPTCGENY